MLPRAGGDRYGVEAQRTKGVHVRLSVLKEKHRNFGCLEHYNNHQKRMASKDISAKKAADIHAPFSSPSRSDAHKIEALHPAPSRKSPMQNE